MQADGDLTTDDLKQAAVDSLRYRLELTTVCPAVPRIRNYARLGQRCRTVVVATESISRIPIPPGLPLPTQHLVLLDLRLLMLALRWLKLENGRVLAKDLLAGFQAGAPDGYDVVIISGLEYEDPSHSVRVPHGTVITLAYLPVHSSCTTPHDENPHSPPTSACDTDGDSADQSSANTSLEAAYELERGMRP